MARLVVEVSGKNAEQVFKSLKRETDRLGGSVRKLSGSVDKNTAAQTARAKIFGERPHDMYCVPQFLAQ